jgi:hypothetical protein
MPGKTIVYNGEAQTISLKELEKKWIPPVIVIDEPNGIGSEE